MTKNIYIFFENLLTNKFRCGIIDKHRGCEPIVQNTYGGVAQLARATGSYPVGHGFKSNLRYHFLGQ